MVSKLLTSGAVALSLVAVPALAAPANPASRLSVASSPQVRGSTTVGKSNKAVGGLSVGVVAAIAVGAAAIAAALIVKSDDDEDSDSA